MDRHQDRDKATWAATRQEGELCFAFYFATEEMKLNHGEHMCSWSPHDHIGTGDWVCFKPTPFTNLPQYTCAFLDLVGRRLTRDHHRGYEFTRSRKSAEHLSLTSHTTLPATILVCDAIGGRPESSSRSSLCALYSFVRSFALPLVSSLSCSVLGQTCTQNLRQDEGYVVPSMNWISGARRFSRRHCDGRN